MPVENTLGYAALAQMLRGQEQQRQDDRVRQQNNLQDEREARKETDSAFLDIYKMQEMEKARQAAAEQAALGRKAALAEGIASREALERSRSADRNLALRIHDENADAARTQQAQFEKSRDAERKAGLYARVVGLKNGDMSPMFSPEQAKMLVSLYDEEGAPGQAQAMQQPQSVPSGMGALTATGTPMALRASGLGPSALPIREVTPFHTGGEAAKVSEGLRGSVIHYKMGQSILNDLEATPDEMFGAGKSLARAARANTGNQTEQDRVERRIETSIKSKMQMWLSDLLAAKSGKTVSEGEFMRLASAVGMAPDWIERSTSALKAAGAIGGGILGGPLGASAGAAAGAALQSAIGEMSYSILNKPNKREAIQGLQDYLANHKYKTQVEASVAAQADPFANSDMRERLMDEVLGGAAPAAAERAPAPGGSLREQILKQAESEGY